MFSFELELGLIPSDRTEIYTSSEELVINDLIDILIFILIFRQVLFSQWVI